MPGSGGKLAAFLSTVVLIVCGGLCGLASGLLYVRLFVPKTGMGWDRLADALGGLMLGGLIGLVAGGALAAFLTSRPRMIVAGLLVVSALAIFGGLAATRPPRTAQEPVVREEPFRPWFNARLGIGNSEAILDAVGPADRPYPFTEVKLRSGGPSLERVGWGPEYARCRAEPTRDDLQALLPRVRAAAEEATGEICRTPREDDLNLTLGLTIAGERSGGTVQGDCLAERPAMAALAQAMATLADRLCQTPEQ